MSQSQSFWYSLKELVGDSKESITEGLIVRPSFIACWQEIAWSFTMVALCLYLIGPIKELSGYFDLSSYTDNLAAMAYFFVMIVVWGLLVRLWYIRNDEELHITPKSIEFRKGVFSRKNTKILFEHICVMDAQQNFIDMILKTGSLNIGSAGTAQVEIKMHRVHKPIEIRNAIRSFAAGTSEEPSPVK